MCGTRIQPRIETDRLVLRPFGDSYVARVIPIINDLDIARMTCRIPHPYGAAEADALRQRMGQKDVRRDGLFQIETRDGELIGAVSASRDDGVLLPEIGYWIARSHWGLGYATEAASAVCGWATTAFSCRALIAGHFDDNAASARVLMKCGFLYTGEVQQRFSVARGETAATRMMVWLA